MKTFAMGLVSLSILLCSGGAWGQWIQDGAPVCTASQNQEYPRIAPDGAGGAIIVWQDYRTWTNWNIYAQRFDAKGRTLWATNGILVCDASGDQVRPGIVSDGAGGAIIVWQDSRYGDLDLFAQRISSDGTPLWNHNGQPISTAAGDQGSAEIVSDGAGGAIIAWTDPGTDLDIRGQRIDMNGFVHWAPNGRAICVASGDQTLNDIISDGAGGAILVWRDDRTSNYSDIYAQRVNSDGMGMWGPDGLAICTATDSQLRPRLLLQDDGGAIITWYDFRNSSTWDDIYAQKVTGTGGVLWAADGVAVYVGPGHQYLPQLTSDGNGGAIIAWQDDRNGDPMSDDLYAQRIDGSGGKLWAPSAVPVCVAWDIQRQVQLVPDGMGGAIMTWWDARSLTTGIDVFAQRISATGSVRWLANGVAVTAVGGGQTEPQIVSDGTGSAIITWYDHRGSYNDIYAQRMERDGVWGYPAPAITSIKDIPSDQGGFVELSWSASRLDTADGNAVTTYAIWRGARPRGPMSAMSWELVDSVAATGAPQYADTAATLSDSTGADPAYAFFRVTAHATGPEAMWESDPDSGSSVDNIPPGVPQGLAGKQEYDPAGLTLSWHASGESDLARYAVYRGTDPEFTPSPDNLVASPTDTLWFDAQWRWNSGYRYKVSALDIHGNQSAFAMLGSEDVTGVERPATPAVTYLTRNYPNPFNPATRIAFGIAAASHVSLKIYDSTGHLVRTLVDETRPAGRYEVPWSGLNDAGRRAGSGVYFYRLEAGRFLQTKKMIMLR
jgi:hypothetical protein